MGWHQFLGQSRTDLRGSWAPESMILDTLGRGEVWTHPSVRQQWCLRISQTEDVIGYGPGRSRGDKSGLERYFGVICTQMAFQAQEPEVSQGRWMQTVKGSGPSPQAFKCSEVSGEISWAPSVTFYNLGCITKYDLVKTFE